jgi:hypothetical protein
LGYAARFLSIFLALAESRFEGESTLPPQAGNAHRWATTLQNPRITMHLHSRYKSKLQQAGLAIILIMIVRENDNA